MTTRVTCIQRVRNRSGNTTSCIIARLDETNTIIQGTIRNVTPKQLKEAIQSGRVECINLKVSAHGHLIGRKDCPVPTKQKKQTNKHILDLMEFAKVLNTNPAFLLNQLESSGRGHWCPQPVFRALPEGNEKDAFEYLYYHEPEDRAQEFLQDNSFKGTAEVYSAQSFNGGQPLDCVTSIGFQFDIDNFNICFRDFVDVLFPENLIHIYFFGVHKYICTAEALQKLPTGELFNALLKQYGKCQVYTDQLNKKT